MKPRVLLANDPRSYRQAIAGVIRALRPEVEVAETDQATLDRELRHSAPQLVICSVATPVVRAAAPAWVELYTDHGTLSSVSIREKRSTVEGMQLADILGILDRVLLLVS